VHLAINLWSFHRDMALSGPHVMRSAPSVPVYPSGACSTTGTTRQLIENTTLRHPYCSYSLITPPTYSVMSAGIGAFRTYPYHHNVSLSGSQDSIASHASSQPATSARSLMASSNNSQATIDTDLTSPKSQLSTISMKENREGYTSKRSFANERELIQTSPRPYGRLRTPEDQIDASTCANKPHIPNSPMGVTTPVNGIKRTADGIVKNGTTSITTSPANATPTDRQRAESVSSSSSKAGEVCRYFSQCFVGNFAPFTCTSPTSLCQYDHD